MGCRPQEGSNPSAARVKQNIKLYMCFCRADTPLGHSYSPQPVNPPEAEAGTGVTQQGRKKGEPMLEYVPGIQGSAEVNTDLLPAGMKSSPPRSTWKALSHNSGTLHRGLTRASLHVARSQMICAKCYKLMCTSDSAKTLGI
jgi:hypothetical protein